MSTATVSTATLSTARISSRHTSMPTRRLAVPAARRSPAPRLTRRGRLVVTLLLLYLVLALATMFGARSAATGESGSPVQTRLVEVQHGDTLWGIASQVAAPGHVRDTIRQVEELNALSTPALVEGQQIAVPVG
jgi:hypothetical protein